MRCGCVVVVVVVVVDVVVNVVVIVNVALMVYLPGLCKPAPTASWTCSPQSS